MVIQAMCQAPTALVETQVSNSHKWYNIIDFMVKIATITPYQIRKIYCIYRSKAVLLLCIIYVFSVMCLLCLVRVCLFVPIGHLLGKGSPLSSRLWCLTVSSDYLSNMYGYFRAAHDLTSWPSGKRVRL